MYCICTDELSITVGPLNQTVSEGGVATFTTTATGRKTTKFKYEWFKYNNKQRSLIIRNKNLVIYNVRIKDEGSYYCIVTNEWGTRKPSTLVHLTVTGKIQI